MEDFRKLLLSLEYGQNFKWYVGKKTLPNTCDGNIYQFDVDDGGLTPKAVEEICNRIRNEEDRLVIAYEKKEHKSDCKCHGCPIGEVEQYFVGYLEDTDRLEQTVVKITWMNEMGGFGRSGVYQYSVVEKSIFDLLSNNEDLLFTVGSHFGYRLISNSL